MLICMQERTQRILQVKFDKIQKELDENVPEIEENLQLMVHTHFQYRLE